MNLGGIKDDVYEFVIRVIDEDIRRMDLLGIEYMCFYFGSYVGGGVDFGIDRIVKGLNNVIKGDENIIIFFEIMLGKGIEIGFKFE